MSSDMPRGSSSRQPRDAQSEGGASSESQPPLQDRAAEGSTTFPGDLGWVEAVSTTWPAPIAHEYHRLRQLVEENRIEAAVWQLKDTAEVLVKFPALVLARDFLTHGSVKSREKVCGALFRRPLSFGAWLALIRDTVAPLVHDENEPVRFATILNLFVRIDAAGHATQTPLFKAISRILEFRNDAFGHGAFRLDLNEFVRDVAGLLRPLNKALAEVADFWSEIVLRVDDPAGEPLRGWETIRSGAFRNVAGHDHEEHIKGLILTRSGQPPLHLWPLIGLRDCTAPGCGKRDVFMYDSRSGSNEAADFILLDYLAGHRMRRKPHQEPELASHAEHVPFEADWAELIVEEFGKASFDNMLLMKASAARYLPPDYLHAPLNAFIQASPKGVIWLSAPAHVGKSVFVRGLTDPVYRKQHKNLARTAPWLVGAVTCCFAIKREIQYSITELENVIRYQVLEEGFDRKERQQIVPLATQLTNPAAAFADHLRYIMARKPASVDRVVIFLDGLDELRPMQEAGIERFLPQPDALPDDCFVILTSRPLPECPGFVRAVLEERAYGRASLSRHISLDETTPGQEEGGSELARGYRALLFAYYEREIKGARDKIVRDVFARIRERGESANEDFGKLDRNLSELASREWRSFGPVAAAPRDDRGAVSLAAVARGAVQRYEDAFEEVYGKSGGRFAFLAFLTDLLAHGKIKPAEIAALPDEEEAIGTGAVAAPSSLYKQYLLDLERKLSGGADDSKNWDYVRRILVVLTAHEEAHEVEAALVKDTIPQFRYQGISLESLAKRVGEPGITYRLVSAIYSFQPLLAVWHGDEARTSRYGLGLKDLGATLRELCEPEITAEHRAVAGEALADIVASPKGVGISAERAEELIQSITHSQEDLVGAEFRTGRTGNEELSALIAACDAQQGANGDPRLAVRLGAIALFYISWYLSQPESMKGALEFVGRLARAGYLVAYARERGLADALALTEKFAGTLAGSSDAQWDDLIYCVRQYCRFGEEIRADPDVLIALLEQGEFGHLRQAIAAQPEVPRGVLLMGLAPLLLSRNHAEFAWQAWSEGRGLAAVPLAQGIATDVGYAQAAKLILIALDPKIEQCYEDYSKKQDEASSGTSATQHSQTEDAPQVDAGGDRETMRSPSAGTSGVKPARAIPSWVWALRLLHGRTVAITSLILLIVLVFIGVYADNQPKIWPTWVQTVYWALLALAILGFISRRLQEKAARRLVRHWASRIEALPPALDAALLALPESRRMRFRARLMALAASVFNDVPAWQRYHIVWAEAHLAPFLSSPKEAAKVITEALQSGGTAVNVLVSQLQHASEAQIQAIWREVVTHQTRPSYYVARFLVKLLDRIDDIGPLVSWIDKFSGNGQTFSIDEKYAIAALRDATPAELGLGLLRTINRNEASEGSLESIFGWIAGYIEGKLKTPLVSLIGIPLSLLQFVGYAGLTVAGIAVIVIFMPQALIVLFFARLQDPYQLRRVVGDATSAKRREILAEVLRSPDKWMSRGKGKLRFISMAFALGTVSPFTPITRRRIRETVMTEMLLADEDSPYFRSSFSAAAMRHIVSLLIRSTPAGKQVVLWCKNDRVLLAQAEAHKDEILNARSHKQPDEASLETQLTRVLPLAATPLNFLATSILGSAVTLAWWRCLLQWYPPGSPFWFLSFGVGATLLIAVVVAMAVANYLYQHLPAVIARRYTVRRRSFWYQYGIGTAALIAYGGWVIPAVHAQAARAGLLVPENTLYWHEWCFVAIPVAINGLLLPLGIARFRGAGLFLPSKAALWGQRIGVCLGLVALVFALGFVGYLMMSIGIDAGIRDGLKESDALLSNDNPTAAMQKLDWIIRAEPQNEGALVARCKASRMEGKVENALADCTKAIQLNPHNGNAFYELGINHLIGRQFQPAIASFNDAIHADSSSSWSYWARGWAYFSSGAPDLAARDFATAEKMDPSNPYFVLWRSLADARVEQRDVQIVRAEKLDRAKWPWPVVSFYSGEIDRDALDAKAKQPHDAATRRDQECEADFYIGMRELQLGEREDARSRLKSAAGNCPRNYFEYWAAQLELDAVG
jgi:Flp pilus assembly protein TadD